MGVSLGGRGGGSVSSLSRVEGNRVLAEEPVLRALLLREDCLVRVPSVDTMLWVLERGEAPAACCDLKEANEDVRERAIDESRRVSGDGESSSSLYARGCKHQGGRMSDTGGVHTPITPTQSSSETDATTQEFTIPMSRSPFEGITLIFE